MRPMTVQSSNGVVHSVFLVNSRDEIMSTCGVHFEREKQVPSQAVTCLRCVRNKYGHRWLMESAA